MGNFFSYLRILWITKIENLIQQFVDQHKVVFDVFLGNLRKIALHDIHYSIQEFKNSGSIDIILKTDK